MTNEQPNTIQIIEGIPTYIGDDFQIRMLRYTDPTRENLAYSAAKYLGKPDTDNIKRPLNIVKEGHVPEIFRGEHVRFEFIDVPKEVYDHLVTYTTREMRVAGGNRALVSDDFTMPRDRMKNLELVHKKISASMQNYHDLIHAKETKQVARNAMPVAARMNDFIYQFNFLSLGESLFRQRIWEKGAQGSTVEVVKGMYALVHNVDAELWETFYEYCGEPMAEWKEVRRKLRKENKTLDEMVYYLQDAMEGKLQTRKGEPIPAISDDTPFEKALRMLFGSQKSMWG